MDDLLINIPEAAHKGFLDREKVVSDINQQLKQWCDLIRNIASYGSNLIPRCFVSSPRRLKDAVILAILLRQVVAMVDGIDLLLSNGACYVAQLPFRALFECAAYIDWILLGDANKKSLYYYVHNLRRKRLWLRRTQAGSAESTEFLTEISKVGLKIDEDTANRSKQRVLSVRLRDSVYP